MSVTRLRLVCGIMALVCLLVATTRLLASVVPLADPALTSTIIRCSPVGCHADVNPVRLVQANKQEVVGSERSAAFDDLLAKPSVKLALTAGEMVRSIPVALLFLFLSFAFRRLAQGGGFDTAVVRAFRRASVAALVSVVSAPIADTIRASVFAPITSEHAQLVLTFDGTAFISGLLLAGAVLTAAWALEEASDTRVALAEFV